MLLAQIRRGTQREEPACVLQYPSDASLERSDRLYSTLAAHARAARLPLCSLHRLGQRRVLLVCQNLCGSRQAGVTDVIARLDLRRLNRKPWLRRGKMRFRYFRAVPARNRCPRRAKWAGSDALSRSVVMTPDRRSLFSGAGGFLRGRQAGWLESGLCSRVRRAGLSDARRQFSVRSPCSRVTSALSRGPAAGRAGA